MINDLSWLCAFRNVLSRMCFFFVQLKLYSCPFCLCIPRGCGIVRERIRGWEARTDKISSQYEWYKDMGSSLFPSSLQILHQVIANLARGICCAINLWQASLIICYQCSYVKLQNSFGLGETGMDGNPFFSPHVHPTQRSSRKETSPSFSTV